MKKAGLRRSQASRLAQIRFYAVHTRPHIIQLLPTSSFSTVLKMLSGTEIVRTLFECSQSHHHHPGSCRRIKWKRFWVYVENSRQTCSVGSRRPGLFGIQHYQQMGCLLPSRIRMVVWRWYILNLGIGLGSCRRSWSGRLRGSLLWCGWSLPSKIHESLERIARGAFG